MKTNNPDRRGMTSERSHVKNAAGRQRGLRRIARAQRVMGQYQRGECGVRAVLEALEWDEDYIKEMERRELVAKLVRLGLLPELYLEEEWPYARVR